MATYLILNGLVLLAVALATWRYRVQLRSRAVMVTSGLLLTLTLVFDNLIIWAGIVAYDTARVSGLYLGRAPIEDFAYAIAAVLLVPILWKVTQK